MFYDRNVSAEYRRRKRRRYLWWREYYDAVVESLCAASLPLVAMVLQAIALMKWGGQ